MNIIDQAIEILKDQAEPAVTRLIEELTSDGSAVWSEGEYGEVGLLRSDLTGRAFLVVYVEHEDFELGEDFEELLWASE